MRLRPSTRYMMRARRSESADRLLYADSSCKLILCRNPYRSICVGSQRKLPSNNVVCSAWSPSTIRAQCTLVDIMTCDTCPSEKQTTIHQLICICGSFIVGLMPLYMLWTDCLASCTDVAHHIGYCMSVYVHVPHKVRTNADQSLQMHTTQYKTIKLRIKINIRFGAPDGFWKLLALVCCFCFFQKSTSPQPTKIIWIVM